MLEAGCVWLIEDHRFAGQQHGQSKFVVLLNSMRSDKEIIVARFATTNGARYERKFLPKPGPTHSCWTPRADCFHIAQPDKDEPFTKPTWIQFDNPPPWSTWGEFADLVRRGRARSSGRLNPERTRSVMKCAVGSEALEGVLIEAVQAELRKPRAQPVKPPTEWERLCAELKAKGHTVKSLEGLHDEEPTALECRLSVAGAQWGEALSLAVELLLDP